MPFLALIFGAILLFLVFQAQQLLETAAETAVRQILTRGFIIKR